MKLLLSEGPIQVFVDRYMDRPPEYKVSIDGEGIVLICTYLSTVESYLQAVTSRNGAEDMIERLRQAA